MNQSQLFACDQCDRSFSRKYSLKTHIEHCHENSSRFCQICKQKFGSPAGLQLHLSRGHNRYGQPYPECNLCGKIFTRKQNIVSHMITVHLQGVGPEIRCENCCKTFSTEKNLRRHINNFHNPDVEYFSCNSCNKKFKTNHHLQEHVRLIHNDLNRVSIKCDLCDKTYTNNRNLRRHIERHHRDKEFKCDVCPKVYSSSHSLKRHVKASHENYDQLKHGSEINVEQETVQGTDGSEDGFDNHTCVTCFNSFTEEPELRQHVKLNHSFDVFYRYCRESLLKQAETLDMDAESIESYRCEFCSNSFGSVYELKDHMRGNHDKEYRLSSCNVCFREFYSRETMAYHKTICLPPDNVNSCNYCDKLFTDISSLEFHTRIFHPQAQIGCSIISSTNEELDFGSYKCGFCDRKYYSDRSLKHHIKLKHTTDEAMECEFCSKICSNKYYLASHIKMVHTNQSWSKCDYCDKEFKTKRNIRRHIEYTHMGMQRYKCIECETLFKEKRSLRKHVRSKHSNSTIFPQCHICHKRFESAKACKIHLKLLHSFNMNTYPCDLCPVSFDSKDTLNIHLQTKHLAADEIYKCEECNLLFKGQENFEQHNELTHVNLVSSLKQKISPRCIICMKDFSTRKTLKRHIRKFHRDFDVEDLANFGTMTREFVVNCCDCLKNFNDDFYYKIYQKLKHSGDSVIFKCETCKSSFNTLQYAIQRYKMSNTDPSNTKHILSELCTTEMSDNEGNSSFFQMQIGPESTTIDNEAKFVTPISEVKAEPMSP